MTVPVVFLSYVMAYAWACLVEIPFGKMEGKYFIFDVPLIF